MFRCSQCKALQRQGRIHLCWSDKTSTVILLSCLVKHGALTLAEAKDTYKDVHVGVKYICNIHYVKAILYIVGEIERLWHSLPADFSPDVIDEVPVEVIHNIAAHIQDAAYSLDVTVQDALGLQPKNVVAFFKGCMTRYSYDVLRCRFSLLDANSVNDDSDDDDDGWLHPLKDSASNTADKLLGPECAGEDDDVVIISAERTEEDSLSAERTETTNPSPDDPQSSTAHVEIERSTERCCSLCETCRHESNLRSTSKYPVQNLVLIGSLFMGHKIDMDTARRIYNGTRFKRVRICKEHFVEAAVFINKEVQRLWGSYPGHGFQVPSSVRSYCVVAFEKFARSLAKDVEVNEIEITRFYNDCMSKYHSEVCWRHVKDPPKLSESGAISNSSNGQPGDEDAEEVAIEDESGSSRKRKLPSVDSADVVDKKVKRQKDHFCAVCGSNRPAEDCREASLSDIVIVIACMTMDFKIDATTNKRLREEILHGWRYLCKKHYVEAATFLYCEVQQNGENLSEKDFASLSIVTKYGLCERIQMYCDLVGNGFGIMYDDLSCFFNDCQVRYDIVQHAEAQSAIQSREQRKQATVASVIDEVVAQTSVDSAIRESVVPVQPMARDYNVLPGRAEVLTSFSESEPLPRSGFWSRGEVEFVDSSYMRRKLEVYRRAPMPNRNRKQFCGLCYQNRCVSNFRKAMSTSNRSLSILLSFLLKQDLIGVKVARDAYKDRAALFICHEHFIQAGASIMAEIEEKFGKLDGDAIRNNLPGDFMASLVSSILVYGDLVTTDIKPRTADLYNLYIFINDYLNTYHENSDWKIQEISMNTETTLDVKQEEPSPSSSVEILFDTENVKDAPNDDAADVEILQNNREEELFASCKQENGDTSSHTFPTHPEDTNAVDHLQTSPFHSSMSNPSTSSLQESVDEESQTALSDSQFEAEMFKEISITDLLQSANSAEDASTSHSKDTLENGHNYMPDPDHDYEGGERFDDFDSEYSEDPSEESVISVDEEYHPTHSGKQNLGMEGRLNLLPVKRVQKQPAEVNRKQRSAPISAVLGVSCRELLTRFRSSAAADEGIGILTQDQILKRYIICSSLLLRNQREPFVDRLVTVGEKWLFCNSKQQQKPFEFQPVLLRVWWSAAGLLYHSFHRATDSKSAEVFCSQIIHVHKELTRGMLDGRDTGLILLYDNTRSYVTRDSILHLTSRNFEILPYPPQSPDLLPSNFYFFKRLNDFLAKRELINRTDLEFAVFTFFKSRTPQFFKGGIDQLVLRWQKCVEARGNLLS